ncbi:MAG: hypothetical protein AAF492_27735, partial [Verrucomicrobiota bacterium]
MLLQHPENLPRTETKRLKLFRQDFGSHRKLRFIGELFRIGRQQVLIDNLLEPEFHQITDAGVVVLEFVSQQLSKRRLILQSFEGNVPIASLFSGFDFILNGPDSDRPF